MKTRIRAAIPAMAAIACTPVAMADEQDDEHHDIDEIVVTAVPLERTVEQLAQPTSVLEGDALAMKQAASIGETLAGELGVNSTYFGPVASRPVIRGQYGERVRVLANGIDALDVAALSEDHAVSIDSILADRVEVIRGPATLLYGSGAAGGIVNVVDNRIHDKPLEADGGALALGTDSASGKRSGAAKVDLTIGDFITHIDYFRRDTDDIGIPGFAESARLRALEEAEGGEEEEEEEAFGTVENTDSEVEGGSVGISIAGDRSYAGISVSRYDSNYGVPGVHEHAHEEGEEGGEEEEEEEEIIRIDLEQTRYDLRAGVELDGPFEAISLNLSRNDYKHVELEGAETGTLFDTDGFDARLELNHAPLGGWVGAIGLQYKDVNFNAVGEEAFVPASDTTSLSLFVFEEYAFSDRWVLQGSARIEQQEIETSVAPTYDESAFGASVGLIHSFNNDMSLAANLAVTQRHPTSTELYADGPHLAVQRFERGSVTLGNGELDLETSTNFDLTLRGNTDRIEWAITGFINDVDDYVLLKPTGEEEDELPVFEFSQADVELYGFEAEALIEILDSGDRHLHARVFSDFVFGEEKASGGYLPRLPPLRYGLSLHYSVGNLETSIDATFNDDQTKTAANELPTDSYTLVGAEASYRFEDRDIMLFLRGNNLTDEEARRHTSPLKDFVPLAERSLQLGMRVNF